MLTNRSGHVEDRRRRMMTEDATASGGQPTDEAPAAAPRRRSEGSKSSSRSGHAGPRVSELVPVGWPAVWGFFVLQLVLGTAVELGYHYLPQIYEKFPLAGLEMLDLTRRGSLADWYGSLQLMLAGVAAWIIYSIRQRRPDDYQGRYRIWWWAAAGCMTLSLDHSVRLHTLLQHLGVHLTGSGLWRDGMVWWLGPYSLVLAALGLRLFLDMANSRLARTGMVLSASAYIASLVVQHGPWFGDALGLRVLVSSGCLLAAHTFFVSALSWHARYVVLEAEGKLTARRGWSWRKGEAKSASPKRSKQRSSDGESKPANSSRPASQSSSSGNRSSTLMGQNVRVDRAENGVPARHGMSKAERKAMRRSHRSDEDDDD